MKFKKISLEFWKNSHENDKILMLSVVFDGYNLFYDQYKVFGNIILLIPL
jgi:hypothetical protein